MNEWKSKFFLEILEVIEVLPVMEVRFQCPRPVFMIGDALRSL